MKTLQAFLATTLVAIMPCVVSAATYSMRAPVPGMEPKAPAVPEVHYAGRWSKWESVGGTSHATEALARDAAADYSWDGVAYFSAATVSTWEAVFNQSEIPSTGCNEIGSRQPFGVYRHGIPNGWVSSRLVVTCTK